MLMVCLMHLYDLRKQRALRQQQEHGIGTASLDGERGERGEGRTYDDYDTNVDLRSSSSAAPIKVGKKTGGKRGDMRQHEIELPKRNYAEI